MGFGLWENLDPTKPKKPKKRPPPPPPPKAEPIMYNCTVAVSGTINSKELDDLNTMSWFSQLECRRDWVAGGGVDLLAGQPEPYQEFEKADMSDMFSRAMLEKMQLVGKFFQIFPFKMISRVIYKCTCRRPSGPVHLLRLLPPDPGQDHHRHGQQVPPCLLRLHLLSQTIPRQPIVNRCATEKLIYFLILNMSSMLLNCLSDRKYKTDPRERKPYCAPCFEKLLGHFGNAHG